MKFNIRQKMYPGEFPRPVVEVEVEETEGLVLLTSPWGVRDGQKLLVKTMKEHFNQSLADPEATTPFSRLSNLSNHGNALRTATLFANDHLFSTFNTTQYKAGCELVALCFNGNEMNWTRFGQPHILLLRKGRLSGLHNALDLSFQLDVDMPLPEKLIGSDQNIDLEINSAILAPGDKLIFLARSEIPQAFFCALDLSSQNQTSDLCQKFFDLAVDQNPKCPFWIGIVEII